MWEDLGEVIVVSGTSEEVSTSLRVFGERIETGWEHRILCKERSKVGTPFPKGGLLLLLILSPCPSGLPSQFLGGNEGTWPPVELSRPEKGSPARSDSRLAHTPAFSLLHLT